MRIRPILALDVKLHFSRGCCQDCGLQAPGVPHRRGHFGFGPRCTHMLSSITQSAGQGPHVDPAAAGSAPATAAVASASAASVGAPSRLRSPTPASHGGSNAALGQHMGTQCAPHLLPAASQALRRTQLATLIARQVRPLPLGATISQPHACPSLTFFSLRRVHITRHLPRTASMRTFCLA